MTHSWFAAELSQCLDKMADVNSGRDDLVKNALFMPRLAICSHDLHWHWINWTLLCDTMEVSMLCLTWLTQHVFQPALSGRLGVDFAKNCLLWTENKGDRSEQISQKIVSRELVPRSYCDFAKKYRAIGRKKMGSNMRPPHIQFRDIHDCDISGVHCTYCLLLISILWHRQAIFKLKGDKFSSSAKCRIWTRVSGTKSPADWMPADKLTELPRIKQKLELNSLSLQSASIQPTRPHCQRYDTLLIKYIMITKHLNNKPWLLVEMYLTITKQYVTITT